MKLSLTTKRLILGLIGGFLAIRGLFYFHNGVTSQNYFYFAEALVYLILAGLAVKILVSLGMQRPMRNIVIKRALRKTVITIVIIGILAYIALGIMLSLANV